MNIIYRSSNTNFQTQHTKYGINEYKTGLHVMKREGGGGGEYDKHTQWVR